VPVPDGSNHPNRRLPDNPEASIRVLDRAVVVGIHRKDIFDVARAVSTGEPRISYDQWSSCSVVRGMKKRDPRVHEATCPLLLSSQTQGAQLVILGNQHSGFFTDA